LYRGGQSRIDELSNLVRPDEDELAAILRHARDLRAAMAV